MTSLRPHTKLYAAEARRRLGTAVTRAREADGFPYRPAFATAAKVGLRSLVKLEQGDPVGPTIYEAVARVLSSWTVETPRRILEGEAPPPLSVTAPATEEFPDVAADLTEEFTARQIELYREYAYFGERLKDVPEDWPRFRRLLRLYHEHQLMETSTLSSADNAAQS